MNCAYKGEFVERLMGQRDEPLIWIDADGFIEVEPVLLSVPNAFDFAVHAVPGAPLDGRSRKPVGRPPITLPRDWDLPVKWFNSGTAFSTTQKPEWH